MTHILVCEDHGVVRAGLENLLQAEDDIKLDAIAENGIQAITLMANGLKPDVLLTDLHLGDMNGIELAQRAFKLWPDLKVMILTMEMNDNYLKDAFTAGVTGYILKETTYDELVHGLRKVAQGRRFVCTGLIDRLTSRLTNERTLTKKGKSEIDLSKREEEILQLLADGYTNNEIADRLFTSRRTVEGHRQSLLNKTGVRNTAELIKFSMLNGLIEPGAD